MAVQGKHRFTTQEYDRMGETGVLRPDARVELIDGEIIDISPIGPLHGSIVKQLNDFFGQLAKGRWIMAIQDPLRLDDHSEPQPDLMLLKPSRDFYRTKHPQPEDVFLIVEVSDTTLELDRERKLPAYGRAGIAELWIIDLAGQTVEIYREPNFTGYSAKTVLRAGEKVVPQAFPDIFLDVNKLFKP